ncbi:MAG: type II toxin-antitoxin system RelE/ParE family toxin [Stellaceae bacterium]
MSRRITTVCMMGLKNFFAKATREGLAAEYRSRPILLLDALDAATCVQDLAGAKGFHALKGKRSGIFALQVSGNWRLTFRFENGTAGAILGVNFEDYR